MKKLICILGIVCLLFTASCATQHTNIDSRLDNIELKTDKALDESSTALERAKECNDTNKKLLQELKAQ